MAINATDFLAALEEIEASKGISKETILQFLEESLIKAYKKQLGGDDANVRASIDPEKGTIELCQVKDVVKEVEDDFLQISVEDANALDSKKKYKAGDEFIIEAPIDELRKATAMSVKSMLKQKFAEAEKSILYETFKDKIGTIITGKVEKVDERGISVNIVKTSVYLPKKELIGDERFIVGETIKIYVDGVESGTKGARISVTRSKEGFLRCLCAEEIHEIYDGTIQIKGIAREAGERSKVAVYSPDPKIDPAGACIGPNGSRIQKIVSQLGNGGINKEKIDIIGYSDNTALYIMEALKPAHALGIVLDEEAKTAVVVVKDDSLSLAIGRRGVNVRLAVKLTGFNIDVKTETQAVEENLEYTSFEEIQAIEDAKREQAQVAVEEQATPISVLPGLPEGYVAPQDRVYEEESSNDDEDLNEALEAEAEKKEEKAEVEEEPAPIIEAIKEETKVEAPKKEEKKEEKKEVKTTTSIEDLEKSLADESARKASKQGKKNFKKNNKKAEEEEEDNEKPVIATGERMSIYTEEELRQMEEEDKEAEEDYEDEEVDYDEYDEYYEDDR